VAAWKIHSQPQPLTDRARKESLERMCNYTSLSEEELKHMRILEIGGPVVERAFDDASIPPKLVLDPLLPFDRLLGQQDKSCHRVRGVGEYLPLPDNSIDLCWCANTIDHTFSTAAVLKEIRRVLHDGGTLVISCNVFPAWTKPLFPLFNILDTPHPHHFTLSLFRILLKQEFEIQKEFETDSKSRRLTRNLKSNIATLLGMRYYYFVCTLLRR